VKRFLALPILLLSTLPLLSSSTATLARGEVLTSEAPATFSVDPRHSNVFFRTKHVGVSYFYGRFDHVEGGVEYDPEDPTSSSIFVEIEAASVDSNDEQRNRHLRSSDFFSAKEFPSIVFESKSVKTRGETLLVTGELTFHGTTHEITCEVEPTGSGEALGAYRIGFETQLVIDMRDYGISFVEKNPGAVGPEVTLHISLEFMRDE